MGGIGIWQLVIIAVIVIILFGTKKLRGIGDDLGGAIKGFKKALTEEDKSSAEVTDKTDANFKTVSKTDQKSEHKEKQKNQA